MIPPFADISHVLHISYLAADISYQKFLVNILLSRSTVNCLHSITDFAVFGIEIMG